MTAVESNAVAERVTENDGRSKTGASTRDDEALDENDCRLIDAFVGYLKALSLETIFGVPGGLLHPFFEAVEKDSDLRLFVAKHEEGAAFMADGYARSSGKMAVCAGTSGPGSTNLLTGVGVAFSDAIPMLVITGQAPCLAHGKGSVQETGRQDIDVVSIFEPVTKYSAMVESPGRLLHHLRRAIRLAMSGRPGPVHLNVPVDLWKQTVPHEVLDERRIRVHSSGFDPDAVDRAVELLLDARRPVVLAGGGARAGGGERGRVARESLIELVEQIDARLVTSPRGKGVFPEEHPQWLGVCGYAGHEVAAETVLGADVDVLLVVGASLNETTTFGWLSDFQPSHSLIHLDVDADRIGRNYPVDVGLLGDASIVLTQLVERVRAELCHRAPHSTWSLSEVSSSPPSCRPQSRDTGVAPVSPSPADPLSPKQWRADLQEALPPDALLFSDIGGHMLFNIHELRIRRGQEFVLNLGFGSMGHGTVAPIGAHLAEPERPIVAIIGDGCFAMNGMELLVAVEYDIPVVWIVENNQMHGISWHISKALSGRPLDSIKNNRPVDIAAIATAMGLRTHVVDRAGQIQSVVKSSLTNRQGPTLIEVLVDPTIAPPIEDRTRSIGGFR